MAALRLKACCAAEFPLECSTPVSRCKAHRLSLPIDPISGRPARALIKTIQIAPLLRYWKLCAHDVSRLYQGVSEIGLYESEEGLLFTHPMVAGDGPFYEAAYRRMKLEASWKTPRDEHLRVALLVKDGQTVLDVGCGDGIFGRALGGRGRYVGIDYAAHGTRDTVLDIRTETLDDHLCGHEARYDMVTAFHVIEHVTQPLEFARKLARAAKPGGRVVIAVPKASSKMMELPAFPLNMPPHHLTHWTPQSLIALVARAGLRMESLHEDLISPTDDALLWMHHFAPLKTVAKGEFTRLDRKALAAMLTAYVKSRLFGWRKPYRHGDGDSVNQLIVARVPG
jgi:SAM-dependent methyltransferase